MRSSSPKAIKMLIRVKNLAFLPLIALISIVSAGSAAAQETAPAAKTTSPAAASREDYKASLESLSKMYQAAVERLEKQNKQSQDLYKDGLISRVDLESSDKALADAKAKVED